MFTQQSLSPAPFGKITSQTHDEHQKLYAGYVKHANLAQEKIATYLGDDTKAYESGELYRRFSFEYNGMRNHELYFNLLTGANANAPTLIAAIEAQWTSLDAWKTAFTALALTRGIGWAMLSFDAAENKLLMHWIDEQHLGQLQGTTPLIALDMWEHSYVADYQPSGKKEYVQDFLNALNWSVAETAFQVAQGMKQ